MRQPIAFEDIELDDVVEHVKETYNGKTGEYETRVTGYKMSQEVVDRIEHNLKTDLLFTVDNKMIKNPTHISRWSLTLGQWYVLDRKRWRHTEDDEGWAA